MRVYTLETSVSYIGHDSLNVFYFSVCDVSKNNPDYLKNSFGRLKLTFLPFDVTIKTYACSANEMTVMFEKSIHLLLYYFL